MILCDHTINCLIWLSCVWTFPALRSHCLWCQLPTNFSLTLYRGLGPSLNSVSLCRSSPRDLSVAGVQSEILPYTYEIFCWLFNQRSLIIQQKKRFFSISMRSNKRSLIENLKRALSISIYAIFWKPPSLSSCKERSLSISMRSFISCSTRDRSLSYAKWDLL